MEPKKAPFCINKWQTRVIPWNQGKNKYKWQKWHKLTSNDMIVTGDIGETGEDDNFLCVNDRQRQIDK